VRRPHAVDVVLEGAGAALGIEDDDEPAVEHDHASPHRLDEPQRIAVGARR
jgi:hypothetical protein